MQPGKIPSKYPVAILIVSIWLLISLACSLTTAKPQPAGTTAAALSTTKSTLFSATPAYTATSAVQVPTNTPVTPTITLTPTPNSPLANFPSYKDIKMTLGEGSDSNQGDFTIEVNASWQEISKFYETELTKQGWTLRYTDSDYQGGLVQEWKNGTIYLRMGFALQPTGIKIDGSYDHVDIALGKKALPAGFPIQEGAEFTSTNATSVIIYIKDDFSKEVDFYKQQLTALGWKLTTDIDTSGGGASCGGSDCGGGITPPVGVTPYPTPTFSPQSSYWQVWTTDKGDEVSITLRPHGDSVIIDISITHKDPSYAGLPKDVPVYQGAKVVEAAVGSLSFFAPADLKTVVQYYIDTLTAAGWKPNNEYSVNTADQYYQGWEKDGDSILISAAPDGNTTFVMIECNSCKSP